IRQGQTYINSVPTAAFRDGDFRAAPQLIFDPLTTVQNAQGQYVRTQFPGNVIPASRIDAVGKNILDLYPRPNLGGIANNFLYNPVRRTTANDWDARVDHRFSEKDSTWVRYSSSNNDLTEPSPLPPPAVGGLGGLNSQPAKQAVISETHVF